MTQEVFDQETDEVVDWVWNELVPMLDAKNDEYEEAFVHAEVFLIMAEVMKLRGITKDEIHEILDECVFDETESTLQ